MSKPIGGRRGVGMTKYQFLWAADRVCRWIDPSLRLAAYAAVFFRDRLFGR